MPFTLPRYWGCQHRWRSYRAHWSHCRHLFHHKWWSTGNRSAHDRAWSSNGNWLSGCNESIRLFQNCLPDVQVGLCFFLRVTVLHKTPVKHLPQLFSWTTSKRWNHWSHHWDFTNQSLIVCGLPHMFMHIDIICTFIHNVYKWCMVHRNLRLNMFIWAFKCQIWSSEPFEMETMTRTSRTSGQTTKTSMNIGANKC